MSKNQCKQSILEYFETQKKYKHVCERFEQKKKDFYADMKEYFNGNEIDENGLMIKPETSVGTGIRVKKIQPTKITFNADILEQVLPKKYAENVILKEYKITDMFGLINYLKSCGVDANTFKSFINVKKSVDTKELERLEQIGEIDLEMLDGCYEVKKSEPYFKVTSEKAKGGQD